MSRRKLREMEARARARRDAASTAALALFADGRYDDGEALIRAIDADIQGGIMIERCYLRHLQDLVSTGADAARCRMVYDRGVAWAIGNSPTPHTADEAERNAVAAAEGRARFTSVLGMEPA